MKKPLVSLLIFGVVIIICLLIFIPKNSNDNKPLEIDKHYNAIVIRKYATPSSSNNSSVYAIGIKNEDAEKNGLKFDTAVSVTETIHINDIIRVVYSDSRSMYTLERNDS